MKHELRGQLPAPQVSRRELPLVGGSTIDSSESGGLQRCDLPTGISVRLAARYRTLADAFRRAFHGVSIFCELPNYWRTEVVRKPSRINRRTRTSLPGRSMQSGIDPTGKVRFTRIK